MKYTYEEVILPSGEKNPNVIYRVEDNTFIPVDPTNADYQNYLNPDTENGTIS